MAIPVLTSSQMMAVDKTTIEEIGIPGPVLMEQAGRACAEEAEALLPTQAEGRIAIVCGKGNNGGDGLVAARYLHNAGYQVEIFLLAHSDGLRGDALLNRNILNSLDVPVHVCASQGSVENMDLKAFDVIVDAIFGTGLSKEVRGVYATAIEMINNAATPVVSVDIPSGLSSDTGKVLGCSVNATVTVTFGAPKVGQLTYPGAELTGDLVVADIGIPPSVYPSGPASTWVLSDDDMEPYLGLRKPDSHKGDFGHLAVIAGSRDKPGSAGLCCQAACRSGAGLVTLVAPAKVLDRVLVGAVEFMGITLEQFSEVRAAIEGKSALVLGPGLGQDESVATMVFDLVQNLDVPIVIDADALNVLAGHLDVLKMAGGKRILTPHPGEMARLMGKNTSEIQANRLDVARQLASDTGCTVVLKGAATVIADEDETAFIVPTGNPGLASGGSGDVLAGVIGSFLCQGLDPLEAAAVGAYVHGAAGDLAASYLGQRGQVASDLLDFLPEVIKRGEGFGGDGDGE